MRWALHRVMHPAPSLPPPSAGRLRFERHPRTRAPPPLAPARSLGAIAAPMFALKGPTMVEGAYAPAFPLKHQLKDLRLALKLGDELGRGLPTAEAYATLCTPQTLNPKR